MNCEDFGIWAMLVFWGSAIGGIAFGISWAKSRSRKSPVQRELLQKSLRQRLERGELSQQEYDKRIREIERTHPKP